MQKLGFEIFNLLTLLILVSFPFLKIKGKGILTLITICLQAILISIFAIYTFINGSFEITYKGSFITGAIPIRVDYLSAWFILVISFTFLTGAWYGFQYMKKYIDQADNIAMHAIAFLLLFSALINICVIQNSLVLLVVWEIMALSSFIVVIFDHHKAETLKAGINFLIQSHVCILFLTVAFMWVKMKTSTYDFNAITGFTATQPAYVGIGLFVFFFFGFAIKAGFVPFHTWLPLAHPAAPSHISGIMSGVIIKIGIYGILRMLILIKTDMLVLGYFILFFSVVTGVYGVMLAIVQHNLKKLLAYHSIENIGIIGIGIGLGCIGLGNTNIVLIITGFGGALLHTLNHSLFKSLLFFTSGNVYQSTHTMNLESLGGLIKQLPRTAFLFLIGSLAICGLPPFNGFVSEFLIFSGLFKGLLSNLYLYNLVMLFSILGLVLIGGLAFICFTKAFGIVFLGNAREKIHNLQPDEKPARLFPLYVIVFAILIIGIFPFLFQPALLRTVQLFSPALIQPLTIVSVNYFDSLSIIGWYSALFIAIGILVFIIRHFLTRNRQKIQYETWGCSYTGNNEMMQYTASSFVRGYRKLAEPMLEITVKKTTAEGLYPNEAKQETHPNDKIEKWFIDKPFYFIRRMLNGFRFLQNGNMQYYILYGFIFIGMVIIIPLLISVLTTLVQFINQL